ncbi:hypothetical protein J4Q44_G00247010, partial [Coregonus suidteri]
LAYAVSPLTTSSTGRPAAHPRLETVLILEPRRNALLTANIVVLGMSLNNQD